MIKKIPIDKKLVKRPAGVACDGNQITIDDELTDFAVFRELDEACLTVSCKKGQEIFLIDPKGEVKINVSSYSDLKLIVVFFEEDIKGKICLESEDNALLTVDLVGKNCSGSFELVNDISNNSQVILNTFALNSNTKMRYVLTINHQGNHSTSRVNNFAIASNESQIDFETVGFIKNKAIKTDLKQKTKGLILDEKSTIMAKPVLLIDEFDVLAYHGASIGKISDNDLFYLMSRGLTKEESYRLILEGIAKPFIEELAKVTKVDLLEKII